MQSQEAYEADSPNTSIEISQDMSVMNTPTRVAADQSFHHDGNVLRVHSRGEEVTSSSNRDRIEEQLMQMHEIQEAITTAKEQRDVLFDTLRNIEK